MDLGIKNKWALVTGGSHGIGLASAISLAREGCNIICAARDFDKLKVAKEQLSSFDCKCLIFSFDALSMSSIDKLYIDIQNEGICPDILINNVGGGGRWGKEDILENNYDVWDEVLQKNYRCSLNLTLKVIPEMQKRRWGRIISVTSIYGLMGGGRPWFNIAKTAQTTLMKNLAMKTEFASKNITFNSVAPSALFIEGTGWDDFKASKPEMYEEMIEMNHPQNRLGTAEEVANVITFLCSQQSSYINGSSILLDGGETGTF